MNAQAFLASPSPSATRRTLRMSVLLVGGVWLAFFVWVVWGLYDGDPLRALHLAGYNERPYDGQFVYYIAQTPAPREVAERLDVPAYRYQRILLPLLAHGVCLGQAACLPWAIFAWDALAQLLAVALLGALLQQQGHSPWWAALAYGLWPGLTGAFLAGLPEPLAYGWVVVALWAAQRRRPGLTALAYTLGVLAKEVVLVFVIAHALWLWVQRRRREAAWLGLPLLVFVLWQGLLWHWFGHIGLGSGGAGATPWEWIPFAGLLKVGLANGRLLLLYLVLFIPVWVPALLALQWSWQPPHTLASFLYLLNALPIIFLPYSTFREPAGVLRVASGLQLAFLLYALQHRHQRALQRLLPLALALNTFWLWG